MQIRDLVAEARTDTRALGARRAAAPRALMSGEGDDLRHPVGARTAAPRNRIIRRAVRESKSNVPMSGNLLAARVE